MAYIEVDHSQFERTATAIETYISKHKNNMKNIDNSITTLNASWQGIDYNQVKKEWQQINAFDSTSGKMITAMQNYADFLRFVGKKYKDAQSNAVNRANRLPRF